MPWKIPPCGWRLRPVPVCMRACVRACVRARVRACVHACMPRPSLPLSLSLHLSPPNALDNAVLCVRSSRSPHLRLRGVPFRLGDSTVALLVSVGPRVCVIGNRIVSHEY
jgi:hypothetical protein